MIACLLIPDLVTHIQHQDSDTAGKPIILTTVAGKVQAASFAAVQVGVRAGIGKNQAQTLCPNAVFLPFQDKPYSEATEAIGDALLDFTNKIEIISGFWNPPKKKPTTPAYPSGAIYYLDLGKLKRAEALTLAEQLQQALTTKFGITACMGLASGKFTAAAAVRFATPDAPKLIRLGFERQFLSRLPVSLLPLNKDMSRRLYLLGIHTLGAFARLPKDVVLNQFGKDARFLHQLAQGKDTRAVAVRVVKPQESIHKFLDGAVEDQTVLDTLFQMIGCEAAERLKSRNMTTQKLLLQLRLDDGKSIKAERVLRDATANAKLISRTLLRLLASVEFSAGVVEVIVTVSELTTPVMQQLDLFGTPALGQNRLSDLLGNLTARFGDESFYQVISLETDHWLPERRYAFEKADVA